MNFDTNKEQLLKVMPVHIGISPGTQAMEGKTIEPAIAAFAHFLIEIQMELSE